MAASTTSPVGRELRVARERAGLSRQQLAALANCSIAWVVQLEMRGVPPARSEALERIWRALDALNGPDRREEVDATNGAGDPTV